jgi:hypothetical protein
MSDLYRKIEKIGHVALANAASESLDAELRRHAVNLHKAGHQDEAALAIYWARVVADAGPAAQISSAIYSAVRIGAAVERANAKSAFAEPVRRSRKAIGDRAKATAASVAAKQAAADYKLQKEYKEFEAKEREKNPKVDSKYLRQKFLKTLGRRRQERFRTMSIR